MPGPARAGAELWAAFALAAALLHTLNHAVFKALLFLGAGAFERAVGALELDRLGGLLRRMPWTGGAFLRRGDGDCRPAAAERVRIRVADPAGAAALPAYGDVGDGIAGAVALAALAATAALAVFCFVKVVGLVLLGRRAARRVAEAAQELAVRDARSPWSCSRRAASSSACCRACSSRRSCGSRPGRPGADGGSACTCRGRVRSRPRGIALVLAAADRRGSARARGASARGAGADAGPAGSWSGRSSSWTSAGFTKPLRLVLEARAPPRARDRRAHERRRRAGASPTAGSVPHLIDERLYRPLAGGSLWPRPHARRLQSGSLGAYVAYLIALVVVLLAAARVGRDRMSAAIAAAGIVQLAGGLLLAPLAARARPALEGAAAGPPRPVAAAALPRAAPALGQERRRRSRGTAIVYRLAPARRRREPRRRRRCSCRSPSGPLSCGVGHDVLVLAGLLALARFAARRGLLGQRPTASR